MKKTRKVYYLHQGKGFVPYIKIAGQYLSRYGLEISDKVEITFLPGEILIQKLNKEERSNYEP